MLKTWNTGLFQKLIPYVRNARTHSPEQISQIALSIQRFGFVNPILVGEDKIIIAGHGRLLAAQELGMNRVPVIVLGHLDEVQRRALVLADNKLAENAGWDEDLLRLELQALDELDFDLDIIGFSDEELDNLLLEEQEQNTGTEDQVPEVQAKSVSQPGDLWHLGQHKLFCGSATQKEDVIYLMAGELADMVFTDPPYNVDYANPAKSSSKKDRRIKNDNLGADFQSFLKAAISHLMDVNKGAIYICMSSSELDTLQKAFREAGGKVVHVPDLGQEYVHPRQSRLPTPVRTHSVRLERRLRPFLVWSQRSGRYLVFQQTLKK